MRHLRFNPDIKGIKITKQTHKQAADDVLLFLSEPFITIPIFKDFTSFKFLTKLQINF